MKFLAFTIKQPANTGVQSLTNPDGNKFVQDTIVNVIQLFYLIGAIGIIIMTLWGAVDWIFSGGDKEKIAAARKKITNALIGLAILGLAFVMINLVGVMFGFNPLGNFQLPSFLGVGQKGTGENAVLPACTGPNC